MALEWYWWVVIGVSVVAVGATVYILLKSDDEEQKAVAEETENYRMWDLSDEKDRADLESKGLEVAVGGMEWISVSDPTEGWDWIIDPSGCNAKIAKLSTVSEAPEWYGADADAEEEEPEEEEAPAPAPKKQAAEEEDLPEEFDADAPSETVFIDVTGVKVGKCTLRMAYAPMDTFDWEEGVPEGEEYDVAKIPITVVAA